MRVGADAALTVTSNASAAVAMLRVALVSPVPLVLAGLRAGFAEHPGFAVVYSGPAGAEGPLSPVACDVVVVDDITDGALDEAIGDGVDEGSGDPASDGFAAPSFGLPDDDRRGPAAVVVLSDPRRARALGWLRDGHSVLPPDAPMDAIVAACVAATQGLVSTVTSLWRQDAAHAAHAADVADGARGEPHGADGFGGRRVESLTPRELQVLAQMALGQGNREIGAALGMSAHTAKFHVAQVIAKLQANSRVHAVALAIREGLIL